MSYFDVGVGQKIVDNLKRLCSEEGYTIIMVSHSSYYLKDADRILAIKDRRLV
jgi:ABC-type lipoprotein export system ATPase subunit